VRTTFPPTPGGLPRYHELPRITMRAKKVGGGTMSGHEPETMACGILSCVVDLLSELSGVPLLDVNGFFFLTTGSKKATAISMQLQQKGWRHKHGAPRSKKPQR
jgi:hypothetical protein